MKRIVCAVCDRRKVTVLADLTAKCGGCGKTWRSEGAARLERSQANGRKRAGNHNGQLQRLREILRTGWFTVAQLVVRLEVSSGQVRNLISQVSAQKRKVNETREWEYTSHANVDSAATTEGDFRVAGRILHGRGAYWGATY